MNGEYKTELKYLNVLISEDNPYLERLLRLYTVAMRHEKPNNVVEWYNYSDLENIILNYPNSTNASAFVVAEFMEYLEREYHIKDILFAMFHEEGYLYIQGYSLLNLK